MLSLLFQFCVCVGLIFFLELVVGILGFVYKGWVSLHVCYNASNFDNTEVDESKRL